MEEEEDLSPFWLQSNNNNNNRRNRRRGGSSVFLNSGVFLILLLVIAAAFLFVIVPSFLSFTSQFRPHSIKKSWDSLNFVLVLFAIVCGFLSRNNNDNNINNNNNNVSVETSSSYNYNQNSDHDHNFNKSWYDHDQERRVYNTSFNRLRSISSYPDLRQESSWIDNNERWRFYDDTYVNKNYQYHQEQSQELQVEETKQVTKEEETVSVKDVGVVNDGVQDEVLAPPSPPPPLPRQESQVVKRKVKRTYEDIGHSMRIEEKHVIVNNIYVPPPSPPPLSPPQPSVAALHKNEKKRGKDILISLKRRRKKQRQKSVDNIAFLFEEDPSPSSSLQPPPPPPPPPPNKLFQNLFHPKKNKAKKVHSSPPPPPPPPPPPRFKPHASKTRVNTSTLTTTTVNKPSKPIKTSTFFETEENLPSGNASPLIPIPPPPPPPPFKMAPWKFRMVGDYVRVSSFDSSRSGSPEIESEEGLSDKESASPMKASLFCPSPDVNTKADNFIAKFKANLKLEKVNSVKGRSVLGPQQ